VLACRADFFETSDAPLLATLCRDGIVLARTASAGLKADGYVTADGKPSPWLPILQAATRVISTYSRALRLSPASRQTTPAADRERPVISAFEKIAMEAARDGRN
jgi:hypothetical protein